MPLKRGTSADVVSGNIRDMMRSGKKQKQAIASSLAMKRKSKMMSDGGMVEDDLMDDSRSLGELQIEGDSHPSQVANPEQQDDARMLASALHKRANAAMGYAMGGLVQPDIQDEELGTKPSEDMEGPQAEAPMSDENEDAQMGHPMIQGVPSLSPSGLSDGLSMDAKEALMAKKKKRRFV